MHGKHCPLLWYIIEADSHWGAALSLVIISCIAWVTGFSGQEGTFAQSAQHPEIGRSTQASESFCVQRSFPFFPSSPSVLHPTSPKEGLSLRLRHLRWGWVEIGRIICFIIQTEPGVSFSLRSKRFLRFTARSRHFSSFGGAKIEASAALKEWARRGFKPAEGPTKTLATQAKFLSFFFFQHLFNKGVLDMMCIDHRLKPSLLSVAWFGLSLSKRTSRGWTFPKHALPKFVPNELPLSMLPTVLGLEKHEKMRYMPRLEGIPGRK